MAKRNKQAIPPQLQYAQQAANPQIARQASVRPLSTGVGPVPIAPVADNVQLTPIVQPLAFVPYSTQKQPLLMFDDEMMDTSIPEAVPQEPVTISNECELPIASAKKVRKGIKFAPVVLILLSLIIAAVFVVSKYVAAIADYTFFYAVDGVKHNGVDIIINAYKAIAAKEIIALQYALPSAIALTGIFALLTLLSSLIRICKKGACIFAKITTTLSLLFAVIAVVLVFVEGATIGYGLYIVAGISLLSLLIAYLTRSR